MRRTLKLNNEANFEEMVSGSKLQVGQWAVSCVTKSWKEEQENMQAFYDETQSGTSTR